MLGLALALCLVGHFSRFLMLENEIFEMVNDSNLTCWIWLESLGREQFNGNFCEDREWENKDEESHLYIYISRGGSALLFAYSKNESWEFGKGFLLKPIKEI